MKKRIFAVMMILCLLFTAVCLAEEEVQVDVSFESYMEAGGVLYVTWTDDADETGGLGLIGTPGQTIGEMLQDSGVVSMEPMLEGDVFEGWMEVELITTVDEDGWDWTEYSLIPEPVYTTEELMALTVPDHNVMYVAKWAGIPAEEYFAPYEEETIVMPSITLLCGEGSMLVTGEEEQYEANWSVATIEPGQTFGEVLELDTRELAAPEGKVFASWTVLDYATAAMEISETPVEKEGVLCFELFEDYHVVLHDYYVCAEMLTTEQLAEYACEGFDHMVTAVWMTPDEYMTFVKEKSDSIKTSLENDPLAQVDLNLKSGELRGLWDAALAAVLGEAARVLPEEEAAKLTEEQNAWTEDAEKAVEAAGKDFEGGSLYALIVNMEAAGLTEARVYEVYEMLK